MARQDFNLQGNLKVEISPDLLEAYLLIEKSQDTDKKWTLQDIAVLFQEAGVQGLKLDDVPKKIMTALGEDPNSPRILLVEGLAAKPAEPEIFSPDAQEIPDAWQEAAKKTLEEAPAPKMEKSVQIKVEKEKTVIKKGALPFLPGKEEVVKVVEKETQIEEVSIDPSVKSCFWAEANALIGKISPSKPASPGKDVCGKTLMPDNSLDPSFYLGKNLSKKGNDVSVLETGIIRLGSNWADLVPFKPHVWTLSQSEDNATCFLDFSPGSPYLTAPSAEEILTQVLQKGYKPEEIMSAEALNNLILDAVSSGKAIEKKSLSESQDAFWDIVVSEDKLKAVLNAAKGSGQGKALVLKELGKSLNSSGIKFDKEKIKKDIPSWISSQDKILIGYILHEGTNPEPAPKQTISFSLENIEGKAKKDLLSKLSETGLPIDSAESFPKDKIIDLGRAKKDQRVANLSPLGQGKPGLDVYGVAIPAPLSEELKINLYGDLEKNGSSLIQAKTDCVVVYAEQEGSYYLAAFPQHDGEVKVSVEENGMSAWMSGFGHHGLGKPITKDQITEEIKKCGITKGLFPEVIEQASLSLQEGEDLSRICIARGQEPLAGGASKIEWLVHFASGKALRERKDGSVDYKNQDKITSILKDTAIARITPSEEKGSPGFDVLGKEIAASISSELELDLGEGLVQEKQEDGSFLIKSTLDGELKQENNKLFINPAFTIKGSVDSSVGNVKFPGTIQIGGDVCSGFAVMSQSEIKIAGSVEAALLSADGDIFIQGGIKGAGKAVLRTKKNVLASFMEMCTALVVGDLKVKKAILRSKIKCNSQVMVSDEGSIVGGEIKVRGGLITGNLGNQNGVQTRIFFGQDILVEDQISVEEKEIRKLQDQLNRVSTAMKSSEKLSDKEKLQELFTEKFKIMKMLEKRNLRLFTLKERFEQHYDSKIMVKNTLWPGVIFESHGRTLEVTKADKNVMICFDTSSGRIVQSQLDKKA